MAFEDELRRRRRLGELVGFAGAQETLNTYVAETWAKTHAVTLAPKTAKHYASLYDLHVEPYLGELKLTELSPEVIGRWQADRIAAGAGRVAVLQALDLLGSILQRAVEGGRLSRNPVRFVRRIARPRKKEVKPLAPVTVEAMRVAANARDAALISVLAYAGLRPQEALALQWGDVREKTLLIERAVSLGEEKDTKTTAHRTVRLLAPLREDLVAWKLRSVRPRDDALVFPGPKGAALDEDDLRQLAQAGLRPGAQQGRSRAGDAVRAAAQLRVAAAARGPVSGLRRAPARARRAAHADDVRARDRRARRPAAGAGGRGDSQGPRDLVCPWCVSTHGERRCGLERTKARDSRSRARARADGARGTRTPDLLGAIQALSQLSYSPNADRQESGDCRPRAHCSRPG